MNYQGYLIDLDGTIYLGSEPIPAGKRFIEKLQKNHIPFMFLTNNATKKPEEVQQKLAQKFCIHVKTEEIYTSALATIDYMKDKDLGNKVYIIGEPSLKEIILNAGYVWDEEEPAYVVVSLDTNVTYEKLKLATLAIKKGAHFIGTNPDKNIPTDQGLMPGAGALLAFVETSTQQQPVVIGKPNEIIMKKALEKLGCKKADALMVGDNYETDILAGINNGVDTLLVLSGFTEPSAVASLPTPPTYVLNNLDEWEI